MAAFVFGENLEEPTEPSVQNHNDVPAEGGKKRSLIMLESRGAIVDFGPVLSISDPVVRSVLESDLAQRLGAVPYRQFRLAPRILIMLFDKPATRGMTDALHALERVLETSHCGRIEWKMYDLHSEMTRFRTDCRSAMDSARGGGHDESAFRPDSDRLGALLHIIEAMRTIDLAVHMREQFAVRFDAANNAVAEFQEIWVDLEDIEQSIGVPVRNDPWKFAHVTEFLDFKVLDHVTRVWTGNHPISVNLHCAKVMEPRFDDFALRINSAVRNSVIFELSLAEYMDHRELFLATIAKLHREGFRVAIDSVVWPVLEKISGHFPQVQYVKVPWSDAFDHLSPDQKKRMKDVIASMRGAQFVLNRCGRPEDVEAGRKLGFTVFQGWGAPAPAPVAAHAEEQA